MFNSDDENPPGDFSGDGRLPRKDPAAEHRRLMFATLDEQKRAPRWFALGRDQEKPDGAE